MEIKVIKTQSPKQKPLPEQKLGFGGIFTDHMLLMNYTPKDGWHDMRIVPHGPIEIDLAATVLHYAQETFEGMKAYRADDDRILLFRPEENFKRLNRSNKRVCIPELPEDMCMRGLEMLVDLERDWVPSELGSSLYLRPMCIGTSAKLGVKPSEDFLFAIICSPSGSYYENGIKPVRIFVENEYVRAAPGGIGAAKTGANYAAGMLAQREANARDCDQVLWLDAIDHLYVEEVGAMNIFFVSGKTVITPELGDSILAGITRMSVIEMLKSKGYTVEQRKVSIDEMENLALEGKLDEIFGTGTAALISPVCKLKGKLREINVGDGNIGPVAKMLYDSITEIHYGKVQGPEGWSYEVPHFNL